MPHVKVILIVVGAFFMMAAPEIYAAEGQDLDAYKLRIEGNWWFSHPSGYFRGKDNEGEFDVNRDFGFGDYSTFSGQLDWRFKRKHHFIFGVSPVTSSKRATLNRTFDFQGQTFEAGASASADIKSWSFAPGYQYDILRRNHGYLAIAVQCNLLKTSADLKATGTVNGQSAAAAASGSFFAPLPVLGPRFRWYPTNSNRFSLDGAFQGMYLFGYGDFLSARAATAIAINHRLSFRAGYQMGSRLSIHGGDNNIGIRLTQKGPTAGLEASW